MASDSYPPFLPLSFVLTLLHLSSLLLTSILANRPFLRLSLPVPPAWFPPFPQFLDLLNFCSLLLLFLLFIPVVNKMGETWNKEVKMRTVEIREYKMNTSERSEKISKTRYVWFTSIR